MTRIILPALLALLLTACGGGSQSSLEEEIYQANSLVRRNKVLYAQLQDITNPADRAPLVAEFNANVAAFLELSYTARMPKCEAYVGQKAEYRKCVDRWITATTALPE